MPHRAGREPLAAGAAGKASGFPVRPWPPITRGVPPEPEHLRLGAAGRAWVCVSALGAAMCFLAVFLMFVQASWAMLGLSLFWGLPGVFGVRWGVGGARSFVAVTSENLIVRNALRTHTYPWSNVERVDVVPRSPDSQATTQAAVRLKDGRLVRMSCTALVGWV
jgi:hypothetical protein